MFFPLLKLFTGIALGGEDCHHQIIVFVKSIIKRMEGEWKSSL